VSDGEKVVFLAFSNPAVHGEGATDMLACSRCRNKTFRHECAPECAAVVYCAACNQYIGKMGWYPDSYTELKP
jgi:hypothetical protein